LAAVGAAGSLQTPRAFAIGAPGDLDPTFGNRGKVTIAIGSGYEWGYSVAVQSDGKIVAAGSSSNGSDEVRDIVNLDAAPHRYMHIKVTH